MPYAKNREVSLYYETHGDGPAVTFAHGAGGNTLIWWQQVPFFARERRVLTFDHRGFGRSGCAPGDFHAREFAADLFAILDAAGVARTALVCQSMGGWTGLRAAREQPERIACLVLSGTPGGVFTPRIQEAFFRVGRTAASEGIRARPALAPDFPEREPELTHLYDQISAHNPGLPRAGLATLAEARVEQAELAGYAVPTLMISGEHDQLFPPDVLKEAAALIPGCKLVSFPGAGHSPYFEAAPRFNRLVAEFIAAHP
ncbi:MAG TPA: alpha/beta fold hydrolase, partial [Myxococcota bacterium]|nr:alpha/beta fold hydrolase [Myxococcota bacterium]